MPLLTYSSAGTFTYVIPGGTTKIDRVAIGGGHGGRHYAFGQSANGGKAGSFKWDTLNVGVDFNVGDTITIVVGAGSVGGSGSTPGSPSTITVGSKVLTALGGAGDAYIGGSNGQAVNTGNTNGNKDLLYNGQTYVGGTGGVQANTDPTAAPIAPGGGGWGDAINGPGGRSGGVGRVWLSVTISEGRFFAFF